MTNIKPRKDHSGGPKPISFSGNQHRRPSGATARPSVNEVLPSTRRSGQPWRGEPPPLWRRPSGSARSRGWRARRRVGAELPQIYAASLSLSGWPSSAHNKLGPTVEHNNSARRTQKAHLRLRSNADDVGHSAVGEDLERGHGAGQQRAWREECHCSEMAWEDAACRTTGESRRSDQRPTRHDQRARCARDNGEGAAWQEPRQRAASPSSKG